MDDFHIPLPPMMYNHQKKRKKSEPKMTHPLCGAVYSDIKDGQIPRLNLTTLVGKERGHFLPRT
jgi:hypothetical protein